MSDLKAKMHQNRFRLKRSPRPLAGIRGPTSKGRGGEGEERRGREGRGGKGREREGYKKREDKGGEKDREGRKRGKGGKGGDSPYRPNLLSAPLPVNPASKVRLT